MLVIQSSFSSNSRDDDRIDWGKINKAIYTYLHRITIKLTCNYGLSVSAFRSGNKGHVFIHRHYNTFIPFVPSMIFMIC